MSKSSQLPWYTLILIAMLAPHAAATTSCVAGQKDCTQLAGTERAIDSVLNDRDVVIPYRNPNAAKASSPSLGSSVVIPYRNPNKNYGGFKVKATFTEYQKTRKGDKVIASAKYRGPPGDSYQKPPGIQYSGTPHRHSGTSNTFPQSGGQPQRPPSRPNPSSGGYRTSPPRPNSPWSPGGGQRPGPSPGSSATFRSDKEEYLHHHNVFRATHGAQPLQWSDELASKAQQWTSRCKAQHSNGQLGTLGENFSASADPKFTIAEGIKWWTDEEKDYNPAYPTNSHFTQVVWKGTTQVGCAMQLCDGIFDARYGKSSLMFCEYYPPGNYAGKFRENVQKNR